MNQPLLFKVTTIYYKKLVNNTNKKSNDSNYATNSN